MLKRLIPHCMSAFVRDGRTHRRATPWAGIEALESRVLLSAQVINYTPGPIFKLIVGDQLDFQIGNVIAPTKGQIYPPSNLGSDDPADGGFFVRIGGQVYGHTGGASGNTNATNYTAVSNAITAQANNINTVTTVGTGPGFSVTQTTTFRGGDEYFRQDNVVQNTGNTPLTLDAFTAADIYLAGSDQGVGFLNNANGVVAIGGSDRTGGYHIFTQATTDTGGLPPTHYEENAYATIWSRLGQNQDLQDSALLPTTAAPYDSDPNYLDNGAGLQWKGVTLLPGQSAKMSYYWAFGAISQVVPTPTPTPTPTPSGPLQGIIATGAEAGGGPDVRVYDPSSGHLVFALQAYDPGFRGGVRVATADLDGDGKADVICAPGAGSVPLVRIFSGNDGHEIGNFFAYDTGYRGGVFVAAGDVNADGRQDVVVGTDVGGLPLVRVFDARSRQSMADFFAYDTAFRGGVRVAAGDVNADGHADVITGAGPGGGPHVKVFSGASQQVLGQFFAYQTNFTGGVYVGAGDVNHDGKAEVVTGTGFGGVPLVRSFRADGTALAALFAYDPQLSPNYLGGVKVATADVNGDGFADYITGTGFYGERTQPLPRVFNAQTLQEFSNFFAYDPSFKGGLFVGGIGNTVAV